MLKSILSDQKLTSLQSNFLLEQIFLTKILSLEQSDVILFERSVSMPIYIFQLEDL